MQIFVQAGDKQLGPFSINEANERIARGEWPIHSTKAWYEGAPEWTLLANVPVVATAPPSLPTLSPPPIPVAPPLPPREQGDATGGIIPYKNPHALTSYYLGIFGLFPLAGIVLAIPAVILGAIGLKKKKLKPIIKGSVHAWIGIVLGAISIAYNGLLLAAVVATLIARA